MPFRCALTCHSSADVTCLAPGLRAGPHQQGAGKVWPWERGQPGSGLVNGARTGPGTES